MLRRLTTKTSIRKQSTYRKNDIDKFDPQSVLLDYAETEQDLGSLDTEVVDFDDLIDIDIDPRQDGNYLKLNVDHIERISTVHIKI